MGEVIQLARFVKFFLEETFQLREARPRSCLAIHPMNEAAASLPVRMSFRTSVRASLERPLRADASRKAPGTGWLEGRRGLSLSFSPVKRLEQVFFSLFVGREAEASRPPSRENRDSPVACARQDQFSRSAWSRTCDPAHRFYRRQTLGSRGPGAIANGPWTPSFRRARPLLRK